MALVTDIADPVADSYITVEDAASYIQSRDGFDNDAWDALSVGEQELRLRIAVVFLDNITAFRGVKATKDQALAFPRLFPGDPLYITADDVHHPGGRRACTNIEFYHPNYVSGHDEISYTSWEALVDFAGLMNADLPTIPQQVKFAQCEIAYQVVHSHFLTLNPFDPGDVEVTSVSIGDNIDVTLSSESGGVQSLGLISREQVDALSLVTMYLKPYTTQLRGGLI